MEELAKQKDSCCGCTACMSICPNNAITMQQDNKGFYYPEVDSEKCVNCGLCLQVCNFKKFTPTGKKPECFAVKHKDAEEIKTSRSGAFFMALCEEIINTGNGVVFGCKLNDECVPIHSWTDTYEGCYSFKGSKYVQSRMGNSYAECKKFLTQGKYVLFSGTGCQIHGLLSFLEASNTPTDKLVTVDIVCHGVPSPGVWTQFLSEYEKRIKDKVKSVNFRDKSINGWGDHIESYTTQSGRVYSGKNWTYMFYKHILIRESCYRCVYTTTERKSDFTIADYWGIGNNVPEFDDNKGTSLVLVHTDKGKRIFERLGTVKSVATKLENSMQAQMSRPIRKGSDYKFFWKLYDRNKSKAFSLYFFPSKSILFLRKCTQSGKNLVKKVLKK